MQSLHPVGKGLKPLYAWIFGWDGLESDRHVAGQNTCHHSACDPHAEAEKPSCFPPPGGV